MLIDKADFHCCSLNERPKCFLIGTLGVIAVPKVFLTCVCVCLCVFSISLLMGRSTLLWIHFMNTLNSSPKTNMQRHDSTAEFFFPPRQMGIFMKRKEPEKICVCYLLNGEKTKENVKERRWCLIGDFLCFLMN